MNKTRQATRLTWRIAIAATLVVAGIGATIIPTKKAAAACATPSTNYGTATMQLTITTAGTYKLWTRMQAPDANNNSFLLEIDGGTCFTVGDSNITANTWTWVNHQGGNINNKITANLSAGTHTLKVIGREPNVKLDRILAASDQNCTPTGMGDNCMVVADTTKPAVTITAPAENATVSGTTTIKATATDNKAVTKVEFYVQNTLKSTDTSAPYEYAWNTNDLTNGVYSIVAKAHDADGNNNTDSQSVTVKNGDSQAPTAPASLRSTATAYNSVSLAWNASTDNVGVTAYRVIRNNVVLATVTTTSYKDSSASASTAYAYQVVAVDAANNVSSASNTLNITTPAPATTDTTAPSKPGSLTATPVSTSQINVAWSPSTDNVGVKEYIIYRNGSEITRTTSTSYGDGSLSANTSYSYQVAARDAANNMSAKSDTVSAKTAANTSPQVPTEGKSTIRGTVQGRNGRPIPGARVTIWVDGKRYQTSTNWRGRYILTRVPSGTYEVHYSAWNYQRMTKSTTLNPGKTKWQDITLSRR